MASTAQNPFLALGDEAFVSLTTFRKSGDPVSTPVWIARDGDGLVVITPTESGKVKRIRRNGRVELRPCSRRGKVDADAVAVTGIADLVTGNAADHATQAIKKKYGVEYRIVMFIESVVSRRRKPRVIVRVVSAESF